MRCAVGLIVGLLLALVSSCLSMQNAFASAEADEVKTIPRFADDPTLDRAKAEVLAEETERAPDSRTRAMADLFLGEAYRGRLQDPARAARHFRRVTESAHVDDLTRRIAQGGLVDTLVATGARDEALRVATRSGDAELVRRANVALRRHRLHLGSIAGLGAFALFASVALLRAARGKRLDAARAPLRRFGGAALGFAAWLGAAGALLARAYDSGDPSPFVRLAIVIVPIALLARAWSAVGSTKPAARAARGIVAGQAALAGAFLALESVDPRLLEGFGL